MNIRVLPFFLLGRISVLRVNNMLLKTEVKALKAERDILHKKEDALKTKVERYWHSIKLLEKDVAGAKEDAVKTFSKFLIDRSEGGSIEIQNLPDLTFAYINGERKNE